MAYIVAKTGELPHRLERTSRNEHAEGTRVCAVLALGIANLVPLDATPLWVVASVVIEIVYRYITG